MGKRRKTVVADFEGTSAWYGWSPEEALEYGEPTRRTEGRGERLIRKRYGLTGPAGAKTLDVDDIGEVKEISDPEFRVGAIVFDAFVDALLEARFRHIISDDQLRLWMKGKVCKSIWMSWEENLQTLLRGAFQTAVKHYRSFFFVCESGYIHVPERDFAVAVDFSRWTCNEPKGIALLEPYLEFVKNRDEALVKSQQLTFTQPTVQQHRIIT